MHLSLGALVARPTLVLGAVSGVLLAVDMPTWRELSALAMVGLILRWMIARENRREVRDLNVDAATHRRITSLERNVGALRREVTEQRHLKHDFEGKVIALQNALKLVRIQARRCSCGALDPIQQLLEEIGTHDSHP